MKALVTYFSVAVFVVLLLLCSLRLQKRYQYAKPQELSINEIKTYSKDSLIILL